MNGNVAALSIESFYRVFYRIPADLCLQEEWHHSIPVKMAPF
jgi:hypothetical protein